MRLMRADLHSFEFYRYEKADSGYVGTAIEKRFAGKFSAAVKPVSDSLSAELYGERVRNMIQLTVLKDKAMLLFSNGDGFRDENGRQYRIISIAEYSSHILVTGELEGA